MNQRPAKDEAADYYFTYIDQVPEGDVLVTLHDQMREITDLLGAITEERSRERYAEGKWSIREVLGHINDCERLFVFRALWFARGFDSPLPSFDQDFAMAAAKSNDVPVRDLLQEFLSIRAATILFVKGLPAEAWSRSGIASERPFSVRALVFISAGHAAHHIRLLRERYFAVQK